MDEGEYKIRQRDRNWKWSTRSRDSTTSRLVVLSICYHIEQLTNVMQATRALFRFIKAAFHYSSKLQTCCINLDMSRLMQQVRDQVFDKKSRKRVESMSQTRTNLSKTWLQTWSKTRFASQVCSWLE